MTATLARGTKRHCQNAQCGLPFYDLNRGTYGCPHCGTAYVPVIAAPVEARRPFSRSPMRAALPIVKQEVAVVEDAADNGDIDVDVDVEADGEDALQDAGEALLDDDETEGSGAIDVVPPGGRDDD